VSATWNQTEQTAKDFFDVPGAKATLDGPQLEAQWVKRQAAVTWITGVGGFDGTVRLESPDGTTDVDGDDLFWNGYAYAKVRGLGPLEITAGMSVESVEAPVGFLPPRDSRIGVADLPFTKTDVSPKVGVTATFGSGTTVRAGVYQRLAPFLGRLQTLEPTQVAGFNAFFEDPGGTRSQNYGIGIDQVFGTRWFLGASYLKRELRIPEGYCATPDPFSGCAFQVATEIAERESTDRWGTAYASAALARWMTIGVSYSRVNREFDTTSVSPVGLFQDRISTEQVRPELRFFWPIGIFVRASGTRYDQEVDQFDDLTSTVRTTVESAFWVADAAVGYRFPDRWGSFVVEGTNLLNKKFEFYERSVQEQVVPARSVVARLEITY
jgi:hypothetical protein